MFIHSVKVKGFAMQDFFSFSVIFQQALMQGISDLIKFLILVELYQIKFSSNFIS